MNHFHALPVPYIAASRCKKLQWQQLCYKLWDDVIPIIRGYSLLQSLPTARWLPPLADCSYSAYVYAAQCGVSLGYSLMFSQYTHWFTQDVFLFSSTTCVSIHEHHSWIRQHCCLMPFKQNLLHSHSFCLSWWQSQLPAGGTSSCSTAHLGGCELFLPRVLRDHHPSSLHLASSLHLLCVLHSFFCKQWSFWVVPCLSFTMQDSS